MYGRRGVSLPENKTVMADITNKQKKELARTLYLKERLTQKEIAQKVAVSQQTLSKWVREEDWEALRAGLTVTKDEQIRNLYRQVEELNRVILSRSEGERFATTAECDSLGKLAAAIRKLENDVGISDFVGVGIRFMEFIRRTDLAEAQKLAGYWDAFLLDVIKTSRR